MKKLLLGAFTLVLLVGCGKKVQLTPKEEKIKLIKLVYAKETKAIKEYNEIKEKLVEQIAKGENKAIEELERWESIEGEEEARKMTGASEESMREAERMRKVQW